MDVRPTRIEVDLDAIAQNLGAIRSRRPGRSICCVIKADAYGHGLVPVAKTLVYAGVEWLAVALVEEGVVLRNAGIQTPILVLGGALDGGYEAIVEHTLTPVVFRPEHVRMLGATGRRVSVHLKVDTGMARLGVQPPELDDLLRTFHDQPSVLLDGLMTHFANADEEDHDTNQRQMALFRNALARVRTSGFSPKHIHASNSAALSSFDDGETTWVRPGLLTYGLSPLNPADPELRPAMRWTTSPVLVKTVSAGTSVSYGAQWTAKQDSVLATLPVGYADGYPRSLGNKSHALVNGRRVPVVGTVCMDMCMIDVTDAGPVAVGDEVVLLGQQGDAYIGAHELAKHAGTIVYEIVTGVQKRVPRVYVGSLADRIVA